jgi:hypothetical protein
MTRAQSLAQRWPSYVALAVSIALLVAALVGAAETGAFGTNPRSLQTEQREAVKRLRLAAENACSAGRPRDCLGLYNEAKVLDPSGDNDPDIQRNRGLATAVLATLPLPDASRSDAAGSP